MAEDYEAGGIVSDLLEGWPTNPQVDAIGLRLAGALHYAVLSGAHPALADAYPATNADWTMGEVWPLARDYMKRERASVTAFIQSAPQTNETSRSIILLPGFLKLAAKYDMPMHLLEIGASAGLNQNWDKFSYDAGSWQYRGKSDVHIETVWDAPVPDHLDAKPLIASRAACDLGPLNINDPAEALQLKSYVWPDQPHRLARVEGAIKVAQAAGTQVEKVDAADWLEARLAAPPTAGVTVVYHSVFLHYPPRDTIARILAAINAAGEAATTDAPFAWLCFEAPEFFGGIPGSGLMTAQLKTWPGGATHTIGISDGHITKVTAPSG